MNIRSVFDLLKTSFKEWQADKVGRLAAALAYYTIFSLAPLVLITLSIVKLVFEGDTAETLFLDQTRTLVGETGTTFFQLIVNQDGDSSGDILASLIGVATLLFGASGVFAQLQDALNTVWEVEPAPGQGIISFLRKRIFSFGMVLAVGFLLLASLLLSTALSAFNGLVGQALGDTVILAQIINQVVSFGVITLLFALIFKVIPDVEIAWRDVWVGAAVTALLITIGKYLIGVYLGNQAFTSTYGAAGSILVLLVWVFYTAQIVLFGAEFTQVYATRRGAHFEPSEGARWVVGSERARAAAESEPRPVIVTRSSGSS